MKTLISVILLILILSACAPPAAQTPPTGTPALPPTASQTPFHPSPNVTLAPSITPAATATQEAWQSPYSIPSLRARSYGGGSLEPASAAMNTGDLIHADFFYPSDELNIYGVMTIPKGEGPFPVIIALHGYVPPDTYSMPNYSIDVFDGLARQGYIIIHPNLRNYPPSNDGDNRYRVGMSVDVLNLIEIIKAQAGQPGLLEKADAARLGLWAHSMGGEIALRVLTISDDINAVLLYAPLGGDTLENSQILYRLSPYPPFDEEIKTPQYLLTSISPMYYYNHITAAMRLFHGSDDGIVPVTVSVTTCDLLHGLGKNIECAFVPEQGHTFRSSYSSIFNAEMLSFYEIYLKTP